jgi:hypothetical protein
MPMFTPAPLIRGVEVALLTRRTGRVRGRITRRARRSGTVTDI